MNRIENIRAAAQRRDTQMENENRRISLLVQNRMGKIKALAPRFEDLMDVAAELKCNGFTLGKRVPVGGCGFLYEEFLSNGIDHRVGFFTHNGAIIGFGIQGGGCNGEHVVWNVRGEYIQHLSEKDWNDYTIKQKLDKFLNNFEDFEKRFYEYVDSL